MWLLLMVTLLSLLSGEFLDFAVENGCVFGLAIGKTLLFETLKDVFGVYTAFGVSNALLVEGCVALQTVLNRSVYAAYPHYAGAPPQHSHTAALVGAFCATVPVHLFSTGSYRSVAADASPTPPTA